MIAGAAESDITVGVLTAAGGGGVRAVLDVAAVEHILHLDVGAALYKLPQRRARHSAHITRIRDGVVIFNTISSQEHTCCSR